MRTDGVELTTPPADALLELLIDDDPAHREIPAPVLTLAADVRHRGLEGLTAPPLQVPMSLGWLTPHGSLPDGATDCRDALPLRLEVFGLTPPERENATLVARRLDMAAIAEPLAIAAHDPLSAGGHLQPSDAPEAHP